MTDTYFLCGMLLLVLLITSGCQPPKTNSADQKSKKEQAVPVRIVCVHSGKISHHVETSATVQARYHVDVYAQVAGEIVEVLRDEGERVGKGEVLARIERIHAELELQETLLQRQDLVCQLDQSRIALNESRQNMQTIQLDVTECAERNTTAKIKTRQMQNELERSRNLIKKNLISSEAHESKLLVYQEARSAGQICTIALKKAQLAVQNQRLLVSKAAITVQMLENKVKLAQVAIDKARLKLADTEIRAPIAGVVSCRYIQLGQEITPGAHSFSIVDTENLEIKAGLSEKELLAVQVGQPVLLSSETVPRRRDSIAHGKVVAINPIVEEKTGTIKVRIKILTEYVKFYRPGTFVTANIVTAAHASATLIPKKALLFDDNLPFVFLLHQDRAKKVLLLERNIGFKDTFNYEVLQVVKPGDRLIVVGQSGLKDGTLVSVVTAKAEEIRPEKS